MSTGQSNILREYLVALGFRVNTTQERQMNTTVLQMDRRILALGKGAVAAAMAVVGVTTALAKSWEKMFYSARYADTTVEKMQSLEFGARNVGIEAGKMTSTVKAFAAAIRGNPGLQGLLEQLGVQVTGRTKDDVMLDFVKALKDMPPYIAQRFAAMFGIDPETLYNMEEGLEDLKKARLLREQMNRDAGLDADKAAEAGREYMNLWRQVEARAGVFGQTLMLAVLPTVRSLVAETDQLLIKWTSIVKDIEQAGTKDFWQRIREGITGKAEGDRVELSEDAKKRIGAAQIDEPKRAGADKPGSFADVMSWFDAAKRAGDANTRAQLGIEDDPYARRVATDEAAVDAVTDTDSFKRGGKGGAFPAPNMGTSAYTRWAAGQNAGSIPPAVAEMFAALEKKYNLPPGMLDRIWLAESSRGRNMVSPKGALGHMGFMPATAREFGLKDPMNLEQSAEAAARKMSGLMRMYDGDSRQAAAAYNWGEGNLSKYHLGEQPMPKETRDYMDKVGGPANIRQDVTINVHGSGDPHETAQSVVRLQKEVGSDLVRNFSAKVR